MSIDYLDNRGSLHYKVQPHSTCQCCWYADDGFGGPPILVSSHRENCHDVWDWNDPKAALRVTNFIVSERGQDRIVKIEETEIDVYIDGVSARSVAGVKLLHKLLLTALHVSPSNRPQRKPAGSITRID